MSELSGSLPRPDGEMIAWRRVDGAGPTVVWLGGFRSDMTGSKAQALADWAAATGRGFVRFDYLGHGESSGDFRSKGAITRWREDALAVLDELTFGDAVLVGSSMGGWLACLAAMATITPAISKPSSLARKASFASPPSMRRTAIQSARRSLLINSAGSRG